MLFERITKYLQQTDSFRDARFLWFLRFGPRGEAKELSPNADGVFELTGGKTYALEMFHHQPSDVTTDQFVVSADGGIVRIIGRPGFASVLATTGL